ncbi:winged helix DNA-binding domain-containing protein [Kutzneria viridogrisea]|uniref:Winged helix DNA-binding domain-containing protein n=1 Tax=Kutzneria viridogrisea TaxID=47990 RepID=A0ABR6BP04_9PSEU|nr:hypothetical protein [Kutzneria viridogrisea]
MKRVSHRELAVASLARQMLLERQSVPVATAVRRLAALQAQYSPSPYVALFSRLAGFSPAQLEGALRRGSVVKSTLMRGTLHLVSAADYPSFAVAYHQQARAEFRGKYRNAVWDEQAVHRALVEFTAVPRSTDEIRERVGELCGDVIAANDLLNCARALVPMRHVYPSGAWRQHGKFSLVAWPEHTLPPEPAATALLVRRYLAAFGPASREDLAAFTYLRYKQLDPALGTDLVRLTDPDGRELLDLPRAPRPAEDVVVPVRFLPKWDAAILSYRDRSRILPAEHASRVIVKVNGQFLASYLVDGLVAGTWTAVREGPVSTVTLTPFTAKVPAEVEREALGLSRFLEPDAADHKVIAQF